MGKYPREAKYGLIVIGWKGLHLATKLPKIPKEALNGKAFSCHIGSLIRSQTTYPPLHQAPSSSVVVVVVVVVVLVAMGYGQV